MRWRASASAAWAAIGSSGRRARRLLAVATAVTLVTATGAVSTGIARQAATTARAAVALVSDPASVVNPLIGTSGDVNTFPGPDAPFGMIQWSPDTSPARPDGGGYEYNASRIRGFSLTHISGPGCGAFGDVPILPTVGALPASPGSATEPFTHTGEKASAGYYSVKVGDPAVQTELTATERSAIGRFTFPATPQANMLLKLSDSQNGVSATSAQIIGDNQVQGSVSSGHFCGAADTYTVYFDVTFNHPFTAYGTWTGSTPSAGSRQVSGTTGQTGAYLTFDTTQDQDLQAKVGISFVSAANAALNARTDQPDWNFDAVRAATARAWNSLLNRIQIGGGTAARQRVFYTALYHALLHPNIFSDVNGEYMGFDNKVHTVPDGHAQYANYSGWDIYHSQVQLAALLAPRQISDAIQSMVNDAAQNGGLLPKWSLANGESYVMVGDPADGIIGGAYAFGARDFDTKAALSYAMAEATRPNNVRPGLSSYDSLGYLPSDGAYGCCNFYGTVATTLEYAQADFALSQFAAALDDKANAQMLLRRSQNWQNLFNPATGLIQPKTAAGQFVPVNLTTQDHYVEGNASQYRWIVPFNKRGLFNAMGGNASVNSTLDTFYTHLNDGPASPYAYWDNQFGYETPWSYDFTGAPWKTQALVNRIRTELYLDAPAAEGDNDDLGATASMGVVTMLGFYPMYISTADLVLNSPEFPLEIIHLANGNDITISAPQASPTTPYVQSLKVNGETWTRPWLPSSVLSSGARLDFTLGASPNTSWGAKAADAPPSYTDGQSPAIGFLESQQVTVAPGGDIKVKIGVQDVTGHPQTVQASVSPPSGITVTPTSGLIKVPAAGKGYLTLTVHADASTPQTFYSLPVKLTSDEDDTALRPVAQTVLVAEPGSLLTAFNNAGISNDSNASAANFDGGGVSYSAQALAASGLTAGKSVTAGGVPFTWPLPAPGYPDNAIAAGQQVTVKAAAGTRQLGFLGSATNGPSQGIVTLTYSDGSAARHWLSLSDWTLNGGRSQPSYGNQVAAATPYRNCPGCPGGRDNTGTDVFFTALPVDPSRTLTSVTLPSYATQGQLHVFAIGTSTQPMSGAVVGSVSPAAAAAGQVVTLNGSGFGASQGSGYVAFSDQGTNWGAPGNAAPFTVNSWSDSQITFTVPQPSGPNGVYRVWAGTTASVMVVNGSGAVSNVAALQITPTSSPGDYYNNAGTSPDSNQACANLDGVGWSLSAEALAKAGVTPGGRVTSGGVTFTWPNVPPCQPNNVLAAGQVILLPQHAGASKMGFVGTSTNGDSSGTVTITYTDGSTSTAPLAFTDWAGTAPPGQNTVASMPYRNWVGGTSQQLKVSVFEVTIPVNSAKTVASVTLPYVSYRVGPGTTGMHIFAIDLA